VQPGSAPSLQPKRRDWHSARIRLGDLSSACRREIRQRPWISILVGHRHGKSGPEVSARRRNTLNSYDAEGKILGLSVSGTPTGTYADDGAGL